MGVLVCYKSIWGGSGYSLQKYVQNDIEDLNQRLLIGVGGDEVKKVWKKWKIEKRMEGGGGVRLLWEYVQNGVTDSIRSYCTFVAEVIVGGGFFVNAETSYGIYMWGLSSGTFTNDTPPNNTYHTN